MICLSVWPTETSTLSIGLGLSYAAVRAGRRLGQVSDGPSVLSRLSEDEPLRHCARLRLAARRRRLMAPVVLVCAALDAALDQHDDCCGGRRRAGPLPRGGDA
jgi:hypothetical protein